MEPSTHTFPLPEIEAHKLDNFGQPEPEQAAAPANQFIQANKWPLLIFGALGLAIGWALKSKR